MLRCFQVSDTVMNFFSVEVHSSKRHKLMSHNSYFNSYLRVNWLNKEDHKFTVPPEFKNISSSDGEFESHFGMEHCLIHAKDIISEQEFVYYTKQESATGSFLMNQMLSQGTPCRVQCININIYIFRSGYEGCCWKYNTRISRLGLAIYF